MKEGSVLWLLDEAVTCIPCIRGSFKRSEECHDCSLVAHESTASNSEHQHHPIARQLNQGPLDSLRKEALISRIEEGVTLSFKRCPGSASESVAEVSVEKTSVSLGALEPPER